MHLKTGERAVREIKALEICIKSEFKSRGELSTTIYEFS